MKNIEFDDLPFIRGNYKVVWEYIGEGWNGDYDTNADETLGDEPLLRFSCFERSEEYAPWEEMTDSSYCTRCPIETPLVILKIFAYAILDACEQPSPKRRLEELSWLEPADATPRLTGTLTK